MAMANTATTTPGAGARIRGMRCNCENSHCGLHYPAKCEETAYVGCIWLGGLCIDCAISMPREYLIPISA